MRNAPFLLAITLTIAFGRITPASPQTPRAPATTPSPSGGPAVSSSDPRFDAELSAYPYPFPVHFHAVHSQKQSLRMAYMDVAPPAGRANGRTVLLLHGKNFAASYWEPTIRLLTANGFRVIAPDQIGFGKSSKPAAYQFTFQALAENTSGLLDDAKSGRVVVIGHSMGGMLAARFALMYPSRVEKLVLVDPLGLEDWKTTVPYRSIDEWYAQELRQTPASIREYETKNYYGGVWKPEYERWLEPAAGVTLHPDYPAWAWCSALTYDMIFTQPVVYELPDVQAPTLLIIGQRDRTALGKDRAPKEVVARLGDYPVLGRRAAKAIPGAQLAEIENAGHLPQVEAFDAYSRDLLDFLR